MVYLAYQQGMPRQVSTRRNQEAGTEAENTEEHCLLP